VPPALRRLILTVLSVLGTLHAPAILGAQTNTAEIQGVVKDSLGGVLPGASVVARHQASGFRAERISDHAGQFSSRRCPSASTPSP
jgi:hypothetical protein